MATAATGDAEFDRELVALERRAGALPSVLDADTLAELVGLLRRRVPCDSLLLAVYEPERQALRTHLLWATGQPELPGLSAGTLIPVTREGLELRFAGRRAVVRRSEDVPAYRRVLSVFGLRSYVAVPIGQPTRATLTAGFADPTAAHDGHVPYVAAVADRFAGALEPTLRLRGAAQLEALLQTAPDGWLMVGRDGTVTDANPAAGRIWDMPPLALVGQPVADLLRPATAVEPGSNPVEARARTREGVHVPVELTVTLHPPTGLRHVHVRDLRSVRRVQLELRGQHRALQVVTEVAHLAATASNLAEASRRALGLLGRATGGRWSALLRLDGERRTTLAASGIDAERLDTEVRGVLPAVAARPGSPSRRRSYDGERIAIPLLVGGEPRGLLLAAARVRRPFGDADLALMRACTDTLAGALTATIRYEAMVRQAREHRQLLDHLPALVFRSTLDGQLGYVSAGVEAILGYTPEEALAPGLLRSRVLDAPDGPFREDIERFRHRGEPMPWRDVRARRKDGRVVVLHASVFPVMEDGRLVEVEGVAVDVTADREAQRHLVASDRLAALGLLAGGIGHEINNPSAFLTLGIQQLRRVAGRLREGAARDPRPETLEPHLARMEEVLGDMDEGVRRIAAIVAELRHFARGDDAGLGLTDVNALLRSAAVLVETELRSRARVVLDLAELPPQPGSYRKLAQVFLNLLVHAAQAIPPGDLEHARVEVRSRLDGGTLSVEVRDNGPVIPPALLPRVFDPFFTARAGGTGLGLAISYDLVRQLGGRLDAESGPEQGTCFVLRLPSRAAGDDGASVAATPAPPAETAPPREAPAPAAPAPAEEAARPRVLVIDDEESLADALAEELSTRCEVVVARTGEQALEAIGAAWFDAILCDLRMPGLDGRDVLASVRARSERQARRFVFISGDALAASEARALEAGGLPTLQKPFSFEALWDRVERALRQDAPSPPGDAPLAPRAR